MNVSALEKGTGKTQKITITNDKGRLSKEDIERMVSEAEKYKEDDEREAQRIQSKNQLESYAYSLKNTMNEENIKTKINEGDMQKLSKAVEETIAWIDDNQTATTDEYGDKQKELEGIANPIVSSAYSAGGGPPPGGAGPGPGSAPGGEGGAGAGASGEGPTVEEVD